MKYFGHETSAHSDVRLVKTLARYGFEGFGMYWYCNEVIGEKIYVPREVKCVLEYDPVDIGSAGKITPEKAFEILNYFVEVGLFTKNQKNQFINKKILKRADRHSKAKMAENKGKKD